MKLLFLYSDNKSGKNKAFKKHDYIIKKLSTKYECYSKCCSSLNELDYECTHAKEKYDVLVFAGGDGTFNRVVSNIAPLEENNRPLLGYLPTGTINDAGRSFGIGNSLKKALKIILKGKVIKADIGWYNGRYFVYVLAIGRYSDISYATPRNEKKIFGKIAYYFFALKEVFVIKNIHAHLEFDDGVIDMKTPFVLIMNGKNVGGFRVNFKNNPTDGKFNIYLTKPGVFNGLLHFIFFKIRTKKIIASNIKVSTSSSMPWCVDGESSIYGDLEIKCLPNHISIFSK